MHWYCLWVLHVMGLCFDVSKLRVARVSAFFVRMVASHAGGFVIFA